MDSWNLRNFRNDLSIFIDLIKREDVTGDFTSLNVVLDNLNGKDLIEYHLDNLSFHIKGRIVGTQPEGLNYCHVLLDHMLMVEENLSNDKDPLHGYFMNINISVYKSKCSNEKVYTSSWHLDRHPNTKNVKYTHPFYHFQFGGKKLELIDNEMSVLPCPRIPHPPMDIFLGFHFILSNYYNKKQFPFVNSLLQDYEYKQIIKRSQERLWTPYFNAFDSSNTHQDFTMSKLFPLYIN